MGMCLLSVQKAEQALQFVVRKVLKDPTLELSEQSEFKQKETLGVFLKKLERRVKLEPKIERRLYHFLRIRNKFIHNADEIPRWNLKTKAGREAAGLFMAELLQASMAISALMAMLSAEFLKEKLGPEWIGDETEEELALWKALERNFGPMARRMLNARRRRP